MYKPFHLCYVHGRRLRPDRVLACVLHRLSNCVMCAFSICVMCNLQPMARRFAARACFARVARFASYARSDRYARKRKASVIVSTRFLPRQSLALTSKVQPVALSFGEEGLQRLGPTSLVMREFLTYGVLEQLGILLVTFKQIID